LRNIGRAFVAALACAIALSVWANDADVIAQAESMVRAGRYREAYELLQPLEDKHAGDIRFDYLLARSALESGRPSLASFIYERILAVEPNYVGVRLEMGRAYLALGDYARAKLEFETVLRFANLPPDLREQALIYGKAAEDQLAGRKTVRYGYLEYGFGHDSNPQSATSTSAISAANGFTIFLDPAALKRSDHYHALSGGGELVHGFNERLSAYAGGDVRIRAHDKLDTADFANLDARVGLGYGEGADNARIGVTGGRYWLDDHKARDNAGLTAEYRRLVGRRDQLSLHALASAFRFLPESLKLNDYDLFQGTAGWLGVVNDGRGVMGFSLLAGYENATRGRLDGDKPFYGARLTFQNAFSDRAGAFFLAGVQRGRYKDINSTFDTTRLDTLYDIVAGMTWTFAPRWSLRPQLLYLKNESSIPLFKYDRTDISINVRVDF
jgi:hypothetical protein